ncbi:hypothetical protein CYLTODRAFT_336630, partial [Cylindrobasidium torrendii FP15055 ss-10]
FRDPFQLNRKIPSPKLPSWDGEGSTLIDYLVQMGKLARLGPTMVADLGAMAPTTFKGKAEAWWENMVSPAAKIYYSQDWTLMCDLLRERWMHKKWRMRREEEYDSIRFRQKGHEEENPTAFVHRRLRLFVWLHPTITDGPHMVRMIMRNAPASWDFYVNEATTPNLLHLAREADALESTLIQAYVNELQQQKALNSGGFRRRYLRAANLVAQDDATEEQEEEDDSQSVLTSDEREILVAQSRSARSSNNKKRPEFPRGKTIGGYEFLRRDEVKSPNKPVGDCFLCTSPNHFARECPHYGKWHALRAAMVIEVSPELERADIEDGNQFVAYVVQHESIALSAYVGSL